MWKPELLPAAWIPGEAEKLPMWSLPVDGEMKQTVLQEGGPLPGPESGLFSNTRK